MDLSNYPQSQRKLQTRDHQLIIGMFLTWLENQGYQIGEPLELGRPFECIGKPCLYPTRKTFDQLLADYYGIDLDELERERMAILERLGRGEEL